MEDKHIVTIDLGTEKIGVSVATIDDNRKVSLSYYNEFASDGIKHSRVSNPSRLAAKLKDALSMVETAMHIKITEVMVNVQRYGLRQIDVKKSGTTSGGTNVSEADVDFLDSTVWEDCESLQPDEEIVACIPQSYDLDNGEFNVSPEEVVGMCSLNITGRYKVYAVKQSVLGVLDNAFKDSGIINVRKVFVPESIGECMLTDNERQGGVALIDLGAGASSVSIFCGGTLKHYGAIPFGGANITYDIANVCGISERLAENIKMAYGGCMPDRLGSLGEKKLRITNKLDGSRREVSVKYLSEIITARQKEIIDALLYEIQQSGYMDKLKNGIIVTGGGASMMNICHLIKEMSGYNTKVGATSRDIFSSEDITFFSLGASMSSGLLRKYSFVETAGCQNVEEVEQPAAELETEQPKPVSEPEKPAVKEKDFDEEEEQDGPTSLFEPLTSLFRGLGQGQKEQKKKKPSQPRAKKVVNESEPAETEDLFGGKGFFGEDEEV